MTALANQTLRLFLAAAGLFTLFARAQDSPHLSIIQPGGMPGLPIITGVGQLTNGVRVTWDGPSGYYQLQLKQNSNDPIWRRIGGRTNLIRTATVSSVFSNAIFRVVGPSPHYAGSENCIECHGKVHNTVLDTAHTRAFQTLKDVNADKDPSCLPCHTVGYKLPTGFKTEKTRPHLAGVQCENCHGPTAHHAANPGDPVTRPRIEIAATMCGGCHNSQCTPAAVAASHRPYYEEWNAS